MDLESVARELKMLASRERLTAPELDRAKDLMAQLKEMGMSNPEIVELTGGRWSESTTKGYTKGVGATDPEPWKSTTALFSEMLSKNLTLADVSKAVSVSVKLDRLGTSLDSVVSFMEECKQKEVSLGRLAEAIKLNTELDAIGTSPGEIAGFIKKLEQQDIDAPSFVLLFHEWDGAALTAGEARLALDYKERLEGAGFDIEGLHQIADAAGKYGSPAQVIDAVTKYGTLGMLDQRIKEAEGSLVPLEETRSILNEQIESLETKHAEKSELLEHARELGKLGFDIERLQQLRETLTEIGAKHGLKGKEAVGKFFHDLKDYGAVLEAESILKGLQTQIETKKLESENWQAKEEGLRRKHDDLKEAIAAIYALRAKGIKTSQIVTWQRILNRFETLEQFDEDLSRYGDLMKLLNTRKEETESYELRLAKAQSQVETLENERARIEAAIDALKVAGVEELKGMTEAAGKQLKALATTQIRETRLVGQEAKKGLDNLFVQLDALAAKAIEVGRGVGVIEEQLRKEGKARDILNFLQNPMTASYEDCATLVLLLATSVRIWVNENKSKFTLPYRIDQGLEALVNNLGGS